MNSPPDQPEEVPQGFTDLTLAVLQAPDTYRGSHESEDNRQSAVKQTAQERPDGVSRAHRTSAIAVSRAPDTGRRFRDILRS
jgi:hypothetical protein